MNGPKVTFRLPRKRRNRGSNRSCPPPTRLARQLALAYYIERLVESEEIESYAELLSPESVERARRSWANDDTSKP